MWNAEVIARKVIKLNEFKVFRHVVLQKEIQIESIVLNRDFQLYKKGVDVYGVSMRSRFARGSNVYSDNTIAIKRENGQPTDRVTMRDTGALYSTFKTKVVGDELINEADTMKGGKDLQKIWRQFIGLDEFSKEILVEKSKPIAIDYIKSQIL
jgi:hypothetical protein